MTITRREAIQQVAALLGGAALVGGDRLLAFSFDDAALARAMAQGAGTFTAADVALLDEIAETILPETSTPGAKAAKTGAVHGADGHRRLHRSQSQQVFRDGLRSVDEACRRAHGTAFMQATPAQRLTVRRSARSRTEAGDGRADAPRGAAARLRRSSSNDEPAHYFRMMKELALLGFFTSEIGCTKALRYIEAPGKFDPCAPHQPGDRIWAGHA